MAFSVAMQHSYSLVVGGSQFAEPRRNSGKDVWRIAMRATQLRGVARQASKTLSIQVEAGIDLIASHWTDEP